MIKKIDRILIANRGEIAMRIIGSAKKMGVETVSVYSEPDKNSLHMKHADFSYNIGPANALQSYLNMDKLIDVALKSNCHAVHPGYGFLSENSEFARKCNDAGLIFVGPSPKAISDMGQKNVAKDIMRKAGVPVIEGYHGKSQDKNKLLEEAKKIGFPVMLKAISGGGGKGMRVALNEEEFFEKMESAQSEAFKAFGDNNLLIEKYIEKPRHVEVQIFGDHYGNYVHLWERDCSIQRRHQKIIEEAPAPNLDFEFRKKLGKLAVTAANAANYVGAGTVEFIIDPKSDFYFMEMNTRLQVEHPVTEAITGVDLVEWQIRVAQGEQIPLKQEEIKCNGHSFETRVYAEDTESGFMPLAGKLSYLSFPKNNIRIDTGVYEGSIVSVHYDPMIAKLTVHGNNRKEALAKMEKALTDTHIGGLKTNIDFVKNVVQHKEFIDGNVYTDFIADNEKILFSKKDKSEDNILEASIGSLLLSVGRTISNNPFNIDEIYRMNYVPVKKFKIDKDNIEVEILPNNNFKMKFRSETYNISIEKVTFNENNNYKECKYLAEVNGKKLNGKVVLINDELITFGVDTCEFKYPFSAVTAGDVSNDITFGAKAPMPGIIDKILTKVGDKVKEGQPLIVMVAMKMEYIIKAPKDGLIENILCTPGKNVSKNAILVKFADN
ncbi:Biotin/lipoyl attachment domain and Carbamoyl-phosphate synthetase large subunit-like, ATP-binding domain and Carbamoyl-phosphate synthase, large subunit, N-terminal domain and Biotin carboxylase, C-terminal domain and Single hybrid motif domain and Rudiment single hybrid motif domain and ATP-grasp fold domain and Biotin carboxylation domain and ATP-grasp fold, subdomain 1 and ATP-grasp fold, subdomain 2 and Pre-ATP-grasp domain-containing protein [Strongyloides ratti]|uniref:Methylcrotonoyl-CoA carboxylase subunit alpha, mitochondrial n=1 Tax=Strongyloides ratti TaxID=34506 RepID=A0A090LBC8_STRRB|nr:Biotin/lipoyl attachment domain and Carbamoyl-phosphate synthetase large subunit-like, ATP-binding domain and Carbamoyl-phosphate synthase, large subunit, N-terminal domain and Biotin carboxylase, C-terminal domain and Single hybrid motif domain and Rudiment single hybrid motif domain and ATP-grasp fold domain and Biotin carboxylation domain and ATP-grasp fold, subdomain 1 and ATP-grasp fold, subdomain 2 and Pre-ATP-grasp domain-containing protein [Strongyloides ratti]CEF65433.1 Biotin/lipoyl a